MTARHWPAQQHARPPAPLFPRTDWRGLIACAAYAYRYLTRDRGARR